VKTEGEKSYFKLKPQVPGPPRKLVIRIENSKELLDTTLLKDAGAELEIPSLEFTIGSERRRHIDSIYNQIINAYENLEMHTQLLGEDSEEKAKITNVVTNLKALLDVERPFDLIIHDPRGLSEFNPSEKVRIEAPDEDR
ncbi:unnamed protein product, partial [Polarella glacialis]